MNALVMRRTRILTYLTVCQMATNCWVCGLAIAVGWGIRGQFGHERGAMIPGVLGALAVALVTCDGRKLNRVAALGVAGGLGMAIGGAMSYGSIAGSLGKPGFHLICTILLLFKGALWGGFAGGVFGMMLGNTSYGWKDVWVAPVLIALYLLTASFLPAGGLSGGDGTWGMTLSLLLFLAWLRFVKRDRAALLFAVCSAAGFGFGFPFGSWLCVFGERTGIPIDWWKVAEMSWGLCGGLSWGLAAYVLDEDLVGPKPVQWRMPAWLGLIYIAWLVPLWNGYNTMTYWVVERKAMPQAALGLYLCAALLLLVAAILVWRRRPPRTDLKTTAILFTWVLWSTFAFQFVKMGYPDGFHGGGFWWTQIAFVACGLLLCGYAFARVRSDTTAMRESAQNP